MSWFPGRYKGAIRSPNCLRSRQPVREHFSDVSVIFVRGFLLTAACTVHVGSLTVAVSGKTDTQQVTLALLHTPLSIWLAAGRHVLPQPFGWEPCVEKKQEASRCTDLIETLALTSQRTAAGYGRGARVRTLVPSRILPSRLSGLPKTAAVGKEGAARAEGRRRTDDGWVGDWVCASLALPPVWYVSGLLSAAASSLELWQRAGIGRDPVSDIWAAASWDITAEQGERARARGGRETHGLIHRKRRVSQIVAEARHSAACAEKQSSL